MLSFSIPRITADRLARLVLACAADLTAIGHVGVRVTTTAVRFSTTNGRILASLLIPFDDMLGSPGDLVLDRDAFAAAMKGAAKGQGRVQITVRESEARVTNGSAVAVVRCLPLTFPVVDHVWTRPAGKRWTPTLSSLDPGLVGIAQKVSGNKQALLFSSPVEPAIRLERLWSVPGAHPDEAVSVGDLRQVVTAPAYWTDHELAILVMPITRGEAERQLDLDQHALPMPQLTAAAA